MPLVTNPSVEERTEPRTKMKTEQNKSLPRESRAEGWTAPLSLPVTQQDTPQGNGYYYY